MQQWHNTISSAAAKATTGPGRREPSRLRGGVPDGGLHRGGKTFHTANPDANVKFNFGASSTLVDTVNQGAPADVFASPTAPT